MKCDTAWPSAASPAVHLWLRHWRLPGGLTLVNMQPVHMNIKFIPALGNQKMLCFLAGFRSQAIELAPQQNRHWCTGLQNSWDKEMPPLGFIYNLCLRFSSFDSSLAILHSWHWVPTMCQVVFQIMYWTNLYNSLWGRWYYPHFTEWGNRPRGST